MPKDYLTINQFNEFKSEFYEFQAFTKKLFEQQTVDFQRYTASLAEQFHADMKQVIEGITLRLEINDRNWREQKRLNDIAEQRLTTLEIKTAV